MKQLFIIKTFSKVTKVTEITDFSSMFLDEMISKVEELRKLGKEIDPDRTFYVEPVAITNEEAAKEIYPLTNGYVLKLNFYSKNSAIKKAAKEMAQSEFYFGTEKQICEKYGLDMLAYSDLEGENGDRKITLWVTNGRDELPYEIEIRQDPSTIDWDLDDLRMLF